MEKNEIAGSDRLKQSRQGNIHQELEYCDLLIERYADDQTLLGLLKQEIGFGSKVNIGRDLWEELWIYQGAKQPSEGFQKRFFGYQRNLPGDQQTIPYDVIPGYCPDAKEPAEDKVQKIFEGLEERAISLSALCFGTEIPRELIDSTRRLERDAIMATSGPREDVEKEFEAKGIFARDYNLFSTDGRLEEYLRLWDEKVSEMVDQGMQNGKFTESFKGFQGRILGILEQYRTYLQSCLAEIKRD